MPLILAPMMLAGGILTILILTAMILGILLPTQRRTDQLPVGKAFGTSSTFHGDEFRGVFHRCT